MQKELISREEAAIRIGVSRRTLDVWASRPKMREKLPYYRIGKDIRYDVADVDRFIAARTVRVDG